MPTEEQLESLRDQVQLLRDDPDAFRRFNEGEIKASKQFRVDLDAVLQRLKASPGSRPRSIAVIKLQEAIMWIGMDLKERNEPNPYPNSYNPSNAVVEPTADGLKL